MIRPNKNAGKIKIREPNLENFDKEIPKILEKSRNVKKSIDELLK